jgi:hypothetical protein
MWLERNIMWVCPLSIGTAMWAFVAAVSWLGRSLLTAAALIPLIAGLALAALVTVSKYRSRESMALPVRDRADPESSPDEVASCASFETARQDLGAGMVGAAVWSVMAALAPSPWAVGAIFYAAFCLLLGALGARDRLRLDDEGVWIRRAWRGEVLVPWDEIRVAEIPVATRPSDPRGVETTLELYTLGSAGRRPIRFCTGHLADPGKLRALLAGRIPPGQWLDPFVELVPGRPAELQ